MLSLSPVPYLILFILNPALACAASFPHLFVLGYAIKRWYDSWNDATLSPSSPLPH